MTISNLSNFRVHVMSLVFKWIKRNGGLQGMFENSFLKSKLIYDIIDKSDGFYVCPVDKEVRSRMNVPFRIGNTKGDDNLEKEFLKLCETQGLIQLKGHRLVGGIRASLYNAMTVAETQVLADLLTSFYDNNEKKLNNTLK